MDHVLLAALVMTSTTVLCAALVPASRQIARRFGVIDAPGARKVHAQPMPRLGGIALFVSFTTVLVAGSFLAPTLMEIGWVRPRFGSALALLLEAYRVKTKLLGMLAGGALIFAVGLADDILGKGFPVGVKFAGQLVAAAILVATGVRVSFLPLEALNIAVTVIATFEGYDAPPTAEGVSRATTRTVVSSALTILVLDLILTAFMLRADG